MAAAWLDLMTRLERLGALADRRLDPGVRQVALLQVARECEEVATLATLLAESAAGGVMGTADVRAELDRLGRDLEVLTGAAILLDVRPDQDTSAAMLRVVDRHGGAAARRARLVLGVNGAGWAARPDGAGAGRSGDPGVIGGVPS
jgi:hypothetical protein